MIARRRIGRPGLIGAMARTAVVAGTATAVSGRVQRRSNERMAEQQAAAEYQEQAAADRAAAQFQAQQMPAQQPAAPQAPDRLQQIRDLGQMRADGLLSDEEFTAEKARILGS